MAFPAALVKPTTIEARRVSYKTIEQTFRGADCSTTSRDMGTHRCKIKEMMIAIMYASCAIGTGMELIKMGTKMPPPVHRKIIEINLKESDAREEKVGNNLAP